MRGIFILFYHALCRFQYQMPIGGKKLITVLMLLGLSIHDAPHITLRKGLARSLRWYEAHPEAKIADMEYDAWTDALIADWMALR